MNHQKKVFYECFNGIINLQSDHFHYSICEKFEGCEKWLGYRKYCFVCWIWNTYYPWDFDQDNFKHSIQKLFSEAAELFNDIKKCYDFDDRVDFWEHDY